MTALGSEGVSAVMTIKVRRFLSLIVLLPMLFSLCPAAGAETPSLFIPDRLKDLRLPDMPEIPDMPEPPALSCWMDLLEPNDDCPKVADPDGDFHLQFDQQVSRCTVDGHAVAIDENGYGEIPAEQTDMQKINISAVSGDVTYDYLTPGTLSRAVGRFGKLTVYYNEYGCATRMLLSGNTDYFRSGAPGCTSVITWDSVILETPAPAGSKKKPVQTRVWYVGSVEVTYPKGSYLWRCIAYYLNDKKNTLDSYWVVYDVSQTDRYLITYSGKTYECGGVHYEEDQILDGLYEDLSVTNVYTEDPRTGVKLPGRVYRNASGKYFGGNRWISLVTGEPYKGRKTLRKLMSFISPRVE